MVKSAGIGSERVNTIQIFNIMSAAWAHLSTLNKQMSAAVL